MNEALAMEAGLLGGNAPLEGALAFLASRSKKSARQVPAPAHEVFKGIVDATEQMLLSVIETRTSAEFNQVFEVAWPRYASVAIALSSFAHSLVPADVINRLTRESICEVEADIREKALTAFGASIRDQLLFTVWTLRKVSDVLTQISAVKADPSKRKEDLEYCSHFTTYALRAQFSLECLQMSLRLNRPIYPEVMDGLQDGLRSMVNAYAWARKGLALRVPEDDSTMPIMVSDEEDDDLARSSMQDMALLLDAEENQ
ncbi:MAG: hypothetical protein WAL71_14705 [Terriglobales bacterium]|jgi:hypothetical protein